MPTLAVSLFLALIIGFCMKTELVGAANQINLAEATRKCQDHPDYGARYIAQDTENRNWTCVLDPHQQPGFNIRSGCPSDNIEPDPDCPPVCPNPEIPSPVCPPAICPTPICPTPVCPTPPPTIIPTPIFPTPPPPVIPTPICPTPPSPIIPTPICPTPVCPPPGGSNAMACPALDRQTIPMKDGSRFTFFCGTEIISRLLHSEQFEASSVFECTNRLASHSNHLGWTYNRRTRICTWALDYAESVHSTLHSDIDSVSRASPRCDELHGRSLVVNGLSFVVTCGSTVPAGNNLITTIPSPSFLNCMCFLSGNSTNPTKCHTDNNSCLVRY